jgi:hypothetical protein
MMGRCGNTTLSFSSGNFGSRKAVGRFDAIPVITLNFCNQLYRTLFASGEVARDKMYSP